MDTSDFTKRMGEYEKLLQKTLYTGLFEASGQILNLSASEVPHDEGTLQGTGHNYVEEENGEQVGYIAYGGAGATYAIRMHEHPEYNFQKGRKAHYLRDPLNKNAGNFLKLISEKIKNIK